MDVVKDILAALRLTGGVFLDAEFTAPWCVTARIGPDDCGPHLPRPHNIIAYHYIAAGSLVVELEGAAPLSAGAGDIVVLPRNDAHRLASAPGLKPVHAERLVQSAAAGGLARIVHGGGGAETRIICGFLGNDAASDPVVASLPRLMKLGVTEGLAGDWVEKSIRFAAGELAGGTVPSSTVIARVAELLFLEAVRRYLGSLPAGQDFWSAGLRDAAVGRAIELLNRDMRRPWTAAELAREAGLSRSAFAERFTRVMGLPPMQYLTALRLEAGARRLRESRATVAGVAYDVGYESEAAFSRAFKRHFGAAPAAWRKGQ